MPDLTVWLRLPIPDEEPQLLSEEFPNVSFLAGDLSPEQFASVDALFVAQMVADDVVTTMPQLRWVHGTYGGTATMLTPAIRERGIAVSTSRGAHVVPFSEFALACIYGWARGLLAMAALNARREAPDALAAAQVEGATLGIVGLGAIGEELARKARAVGMHVIATKRDPSRHDGNAHEVFPAKELPRLLAESDYVVLAAPGNESMRGAIDEAALRAMKPTAYLINLTARNAIEDAELLSRALRDGWIGGAALTVLPGGRVTDDSPLWEAPNLLIAPRLGGADPHKWERSRAYFTENLRRYLAREPLVNAVDPSDPS